MTINVDSNLCSQCGVCFKVCPYGIIDPVDDIQLPRIHKGKDAICVSCGQCEVFCPSGALMLADGSNKAHESVIPKGVISPENLGLFLKSRRSIRTYKQIQIPRTTIKSILDIVRYAPSSGNSQLVEWLVIHDPHVVREIAERTVDWHRELANSGNSMFSSYASMMVDAWNKGNDMICRGAPAYDYRPYC